MNKNVSIVLGAGVGDEGKGAHVNYLCSRVEKPLVIRFNGVIILGNLSLVIF